MKCLTSRAIESPEIPYEELDYEIITTNRSRPDNGALATRVVIYFRRARILPPLVEGGQERWERDPLFEPVQHTFDDAYQAAAEFPELGPAIAALHAVAVAVNTAKQLV